MVDVKKVESEEIVTIEFEGERVEFSGWKYSMDSSSKGILDGIEEGSIGYCKGKIIRPWDEYECYEPRLTTIETYIDSYESFETAYLACWTKEGCPFKEKCYTRSSQGFV
jgi:hypothetical protein